jgi:hypothetical protein
MTMTIVDHVKTLLGIDLEPLITFKKKAFFVIDVTTLSFHDVRNIERLCYQRKQRFEKNGVSGLAIYTK